MLIRPGEARSRADYGSRADYCLADGSMLSCILFLTIAKLAFASAAPPLPSAFSALSLPFAAPPLPSAFSALSLPFALSYGLAIIMLIRPGGARSRADYCLADGSMTIAALTSFGSDGFELASFGCGSGLSGSLGGLSGFTAMDGPLMDDCPLQLYLARALPVSYAPLRITLSRIASSNFGNYRAGLIALASVDTVQLSRGLSALSANATDVFDFLRGFRSASQTLPSPQLLTSLPPQSPSRSPPLPSQLMPLLPMQPLPPLQTPLQLPMLQSPMLLLPVLLSLPLESPPLPSAVADAAVDATAAAAMATTNAIVTDTVAAAAMSGGASAPRSGLLPALWLPLISMPTGSRPPLSRTLRPVLMCASPSSLPIRTYLPIPPLTLCCQPSPLSQLSHALSCGLVVIILMRPGGARSRAGHRSRAGRLSDSSRLADGSMPGGHGTLTLPSLGSSIGGLLGGLGGSALASLGGLVVRAASLSFSGPLAGLGGSLSGLGSSALTSLGHLGGFGRLGGSALVHVTSLSSLSGSAALASFGGLGRSVLVRSLLNPLGSLRGSVFVFSLVLAFPLPGGLGSSVDHSSGGFLELSAGHSSGSSPLTLLFSASTLPWVQPTIWPGGASTNSQLAICPGGAPTGLGPSAVAVTAAVADVAAVDAAVADVAVANTVVANAVVVAAAIAVVAIAIVNAAVTAAAVTAAAVAAIADAAFTATAVVATAIAVVADATVTHAAIAGNAVTASAVSDQAYRLVGRGSASHTTSAHRRWWYPHLIWLLYAGLLYPCAAVRPPSTLVGSPLGGLDDSSFTPLCDLGSLPPASLDELDNPARGVLGIPLPTSPGCPNSFIGLNPTTLWMFSSSTLWLNPLLALTSTFTGLVWFLVWSRHRRHSHRHVIMCGVRDLYHMRAASELSRVRYHRARQALSKLALMRYRRATHAIYPHCVVADLPSSLHHLVAIEAATYAAWYTHLRSCPYGADLSTQRLPSLVRGCRLNTVGYANVATIRLPARPQSVQPSSPSPHSTNVIPSYDGLNLHLSSRSATGYENVTIRRSRPNRPYRAKAPGGKLLGDFCSAIEAAVCYARHMHASSSPLPCVPQTATIATGEIIHLHLSVRSLTGYRGVSPHVDPNRAKRYVARLGPSSVEFIGYYSSAVDAAIAYALAYRERGEFLSSFLTTDDLHDDASTAALTNLGFTCTSLPPDGALGRT